MKNSTFFKMVFVTTCFLSFSSLAHADIWCRDNGGGSVYCEEINTPPAPVVVSNQPRESNLGKMVRGLTAASAKRKENETNLKNQMILEQYKSKLRQQEEAERVKREFALALMKEKMKDPEYLEKLAEMDQDSLEGRIGIDPATGKKFIRKNGKWVSAE